MIFSVSETIYLFAGEGREPWFVSPTGIFV
jgi:hypothetical protein